MSRRVLGFISLIVIATAAVGLMSYTFLGTATGAAGNASASAYGARVSLDTVTSSAQLVGPLPRAVADAVKTSDEASLVRIGEVPAGGALVHEIAALLTTAQVDLKAGTSRASSDTAHVGLLRTARATSPAAGQILPGVNLPNLPGLNNVPAVPGDVARVEQYNRIDIDAIHGIASLDCGKLPQLAGMTEIQRLNAITEGSHIARVQVPDLNIDLSVLDDVTDDLGNPADDHAAAFHVRLDLSTLNVPSLPAPLNLLNGRIVEVWLYEVKGTNLTTATFNNVTVGVSVDMVHVKVLDKTTGLLEADVRIGHAEATLSNCAQTPIPPTPCPTPPCDVVPPTPTPEVDTTKLVESINGDSVETQANLIVQRNQEIEYSLSVVNNNNSSNCAITRVVDQLPPGTTYVSDAGELGAGRFDAATNTVTWDNLAIPNGSSARQGLVLKVNVDAPDGSIFVNRFTATGSCGTFDAEAAGVQLGSVVLPLRFGRGETPRTGVADNLMMFAGALLLAGAAGGTWAMRRA